MNKVSLSPTSTIGEGDEDQNPPGNRWALFDVGSCGAKVFNRPCQAPDFQDDGQKAPYFSVCKPASEKVFVVEDDDAQRASIIELLKYTGYEVVGCADSIEFEALITPTSPGCVLLDIRLRGSDGISILERLREMKSPLKAVVLSGMSDPVTSAECMKIGAFDYLAKPVNEMTLRRAVEQAVGASRMEVCRKKSLALVSSLYQRLTPAEQTVAKLISSGYSTKEIAGILGRSENTIKIHRHRIMSKLQIYSVASVAKFIGLLQDNDML